MRLHEIRVRWMHRQFRRRQREYQPVVPKVDCPKFKNVAKERAVSCRILAVQQEVSARIMPRD